MHVYGNTNSPSNCLHGHLIYVNPNHLGGPRFDLHPSSPSSHSACTCVNAAVYLYMYIRTHAGTYVHMQVHIPTHASLPPSLPPSLPSLCLLYPFLPSLLALPYYCTIHVCTYIVYVRMCTLVNETSWLDQRAWHALRLKYYVPVSC